MNICDPTHKTIDNLMMCTYKILWGVGGREKIFNHSVFILLSKKKGYMIFYNHQGICVLKGNISSERLTWDP